MTVAIVTDSTTSLPPEAAERPDVRVVPLIFHFGDEAYRDKVDMTLEEFYRKLRESPVMPRTSQPSAGAFAEAYEALSAYDDILVLTISGELSGTYNSATAAAGMVDRPVEVIDTRSAEIGSGLILLEALRAIDAGAEFPEVKQAAERAIERAQVYFAVSTLEYLEKNGRIGRAQRLLGTTLNIRPVLKLEDGVITPHKRARGRRRQLSAMLDELRSAVEQGRKVALADIAAPDELARLREAAGENLVFVAEVGGVIGSHVGPGAYGMAFI
ncbi:DegV family protein [Rubrobacter taiwanensis]|jgi:DegV family protein with EDD domain|uniref:DegV family protein n=1 Tax=Rubrobacter taiwanensis TaxID=185139 RepID=A0A4R1BHF8_9ACTN|nr:DegV family protein [Rubrobacter taiwanensis]TCJ16663.1 DegV family protein [Rubrobacter taiwanensis]